MREGSHSKSMRILKYLTLVYPPPLPLSPSRYSSTCYYYGESLSDELAAASSDGVAPPLGLVHTSYGGSTIEQWLDNTTIATCANASISGSNQQWHDSRVLPYIGMTVKGWVWYQGENDMHNLFGNSAMNSGYSCLMKALVSQWRTLWSR